MGENRRDLEAREAGVRGGCAPVEYSAGIGFAACAGKHNFVIGTKAAFLAYPC